MPTYTYKCTECHTVFDRITSISDRNGLQTCTVCGSLSERSLSDEMKDSSIDATMKENERWSWSMGVHVDQIPEMERRFPGSQYHSKTGQLLIRSRQDKLHKMRERGLTEF